MSLDFVNEALTRPAEKSAELSHCGTYRYRLHRNWDPALMVLPVVMVNPSTADHEVDDPTILRLIGFCRRWGYGGLLVMNLFALRSPDPTHLDVHPHPVGEQPSESGANVNDARIDWLLDRCARQDRAVLCAWGNNGVRKGRDQWFVARARKAGVKLICLGLTEGGHPKHPLARGQHRVPDDFQPIPFGETP